MNGYEKPFLVRAHIEALNRELRGHHWSPQHVAEIKAQLALFEKELSRLVKAGVEDELEDGNKAGGIDTFRGTAAQLMARQMPPK